MKRLTCALLFTAASFALPAVFAAQPGVPVQDESLAYTVNWPSGLSLGEAHLVSHQSNGRWYFEMLLDAGVPGFAVSDHYRSIASGELCAVEFDRETLHGKRKSHEKTTFDSKTGQAHRVTLNGGGKSDMPAPACAYDALTAIYYVRRELGQGRIPPPQSVFYGGPYELRLEASGVQTIPVGGKQVRADRVLGTVKGPASNAHFELFLAQDPQRTPLVIKVPLTVGTVTMELVR